SAEDIERDLVFLQRLWDEIQKHDREVSAPALVYQESELPLRVVRDLFTEDFERAIIDDEATYKRVTGYLKKTSPHMVERVVRYREKEPMFERFGVDREIRSTLSRRVDLPSGGYLVFDYAEAFTVIDVNTGRFTGSRSRSSSAKLEDTITKNNLEAVKEVVRQLRLRDIGGIIVIDFIDMANPKNRALVESALRTELERDRTKTYVVEISPLGLVEMTRQNVTDGPREILTRKCPLCEGDGIIVSDESVAIDAERRLLALASASRNRRFKVAVNDHVADVLIGPGASRLTEIEERAKRRFVLEAREGVPHEFFEVLDQGTLEKVQGELPVVEGTEFQVKLVEVGKHDLEAGVGSRDGYTGRGGGAGGVVGKAVRVGGERFRGGTPLPHVGLKGEAFPRADHCRRPGREADAEAPGQADEGREEARSPGCRGSRRAGGGGVGAGCGRRHGRAEAEEEDAARLTRRPRPEEEADHRCRGCSRRRRRRVRREDPRPGRLSRRGTGGRRRGRCRL